MLMLLMFNPLPNRLILEKLPLRKTSIVHGVDCELYYNDIYRSFKKGSFAGFVAQGPF